MYVMKQICNILRVLSKKKTSLNESYNIEFHGQ